MPLPLRIGAVVAALISLITAATVVLAWTAGGPYLVGGRVVPRDVWMRIAAPPLLLAAVLMAALAGGAFARSPRSRATAPILFSAVAIDGVVAAIAGDIPVGLALRGLAECLIIGGIAVWYLYLRPEVRAYYAAGRRRRSGREAAP